jgi:hypothetical protein
MPWRGPEVKGEYPTLGYAVGDWIEANCVIPDGMHQGEPLLLTDEMWRFLFAYYRLHPDAVYDERRPSAAFVHRGGQLMRPQKWGKGPFAAALSLSEGFGPVRFDGWDAAGEPVGMPHPTPWVQIVATSEEQADNTWLCVLEMARRGAVAQLPGVDIGVQDINLPSGGKLEPRSASGRARLGARLTFAIFDESHQMIESNGGVLLATTMKRNIGGMGGRWLETTNSYDPSQNSIAQRTQDSKAPGVLIDYRPPKRTPRADDDEDCLTQLRYVYGDSWWVDLERILADARDSAVCPTWNEALRYFFNLAIEGVSDAVDATTWAARARDDDPLRPLEAIALGFDGSRSRDCTSIVASRIRDGRWFHIKTWDPADYDEGRVPRDEVNAKMAELFEAYDVWYLYGDPFRWQEYFDIWSSQWPDKVVEFPTNGAARMDDAVVRFQGAVRFGLTHDGDETLTKHVLASSLANGQRRQPRPEEDPSRIYHFLRVVPKRDKGHIDTFIAGLLAEVARGKAIEEGALAANPPSTVSPELRAATTDVFRPRERLKI